MVYYLLLLLCVKRIECKVFFSGKAREGHVAREEEFELGECNVACRLFLVN